MYTLTFPLTIVIARLHLLGVDVASVLRPMDLGPFFAVDNGPGSALSHVRFALLSGLILMTQQHLGDATASTNTANKNKNNNNNNTTPNNNTSAGTSASSTSSTTFGQSMLHREGLWSLAVLNNRNNTPTNDTTDSSAETNPNASPSASPGPGAGASRSPGASPGPDAAGWPEPLCVDPVDCVNSILSLHAEDMFPSAAWTTNTGNIHGMGSETSPSPAALAMRDTITSLSSTGGRPGLSPAPGSGQKQGLGSAQGQGLGQALGQGRGVGQDLGFGLEESLPLDEGLQRMRASGLALVDMLVFTCMMGRPNGTVEVTV